jgi:hypothetical protein
MKKLISLVLIMSLLFSQPSQATFFTDLFGGLFTVVSYPFQLLLGSTKAPFFISQNPFVEKEWRKEARLAAERKQKLSATVKTPKEEPINEEEEPKKPEEPQSPTATPTTKPSSNAIVEDTPTPSPPPKDFTIEDLRLVDIICFIVGAIGAGAGIGAGVGAIAGAGAGIAAGLRVGAIARVAGVGALAGALAGVGALAAAENRLGGSVVVAGVVGGALGLAFVGGGATAVFIELWIVAIGISARIRRPLIREVRTGVLARVIGAVREGAAVGAAGVNTLLVAIGLIVG